MIIAQATAHAKKHERHARQKRPKLRQNKQKERPATLAICMPSSHADAAEAQRVCEAMTALVLQAAAVRDHRLQVTDITTATMSTALATTRAASPLDLQRELQLHQAFCTQPVTSRADSTAQQALSERQAARTASLDRAATGRVKLTVNAQRPQATAQLASISTPAEYQRMTAQWIRDLLVDSLSVEYRGNRLSIIGHWQRHCNEGWNTSFVRVEWLSAATMPLVLTYEETLAMSFFGHMVFRLKGLGPVIAWTHVRQFHIHIGITPPPMIRLQNAMRLLRHKIKRGEVHTDSRGFATPSHVRALARHYRQRKDNYALAWEIRLIYALKLAILCFAFQMAMRIIEVARGAAYTHKLHWAIKHFARAQALTVESGEHITVKPTQRKCPTAAAKRPVPMLYEADCEINAIRAYRELRELDPATEHHERNHCAFRVNSKGHAPSSKWFRTEFTTELQQACPDASLTIRQTPHILRRGALSAHVHNHIDPVIIDIIAVLAPRSTRGIYTGCIPSAIIDAQRRLPTANFTALDDGHNHVYPDTSDSDTREWRTRQTEEHSDDDSEDDTTWALPQTTEPAKRRVGRPAKRDTLAHAAQTQPSIRHAFSTARTSAQSPNAPPPTAPTLSIADYNSATPSSTASAERPTRSPTRTLGLRHDYTPQPGDCPLAGFAFGRPSEDHCKQFQFAIVHDHKRCKRKASHQCYLCGNKRHGAFECNETKASKAQSFIVRRFRAENYREISKHFHM